MSTTELRFPNVGETHEPTNAVGNQGEQGPDPVPVQELLTVDPKANRDRHGRDILIAAGMLLAAGIVWHRTNELLVTILVGVAVNLLTKPVQAIALNPAAAALENAAAQLRFIRPRRFLIAIARALYSERVDLKPSRWTIASTIIFCSIALLISSIERPQQFDLQTAPTTTTSPSTNTSSETTPSATTRPDSQQGTVDNSGPKSSDGIANQPDPSLGYGSIQSTESAVGVGDASQTTQPPSGPSLGAGSVPTSGSNGAAPGSSTSPVIITGQTGPTVPVLVTPSSAGGIGSNTGGSGATAPPTRPEIQIVSTTWGDGCSPTPCVNGVATLRYRNADYVILISQLLGGDGSPGSIYTVELSLTPSADWQTGVVQMPYVEGQQTCVLGEADHMTLISDPLFDCSFA